MKKDRATLKAYFNKGDIPTEANFADLIDSMLNQDDDNISKLPNDPLQITPSSVDENLINFYLGESGNPILTWQIKQKPDGKSVLSIGYETASRLFIESGTGNVGIGTTNPGAKVDVEDASTGVPFFRANQLTVDSAQGGGLVNLVAGAQINLNGGHKYIGTRGASKLQLHDGIVRLSVGGMAGEEGKDVTWIDALNIEPNGNVGIGMTNPDFKLDVNGSVRFNLPSAGNFTDFRINKGNGSLGLIVGNNGTVGLGALDPGIQLDIRSGQGTTGNSAIRAIYPGGGSLTGTEIAALAHRGGVWTALYAKQGAASSAAYFDGNVGVGISGPTRKLEIGGNAGNLLWAGASTGSTANIDLSGHVQLREYSTNNLAYFQARDDSSNRNIGLRIRTQKAGATAPSIIEAVTIQANGNVSMIGMILQENWKEVGASGSPAFQSGWTNYSTTFNTAGYFKDSLGIVHLKGLVKNGVIGDAQTIFTLPVGFQPLKRELHVVFTNDQAGRLDILENGRVVPVQGGPAWFSLDGVSFRAGEENIIVIGDIDIGSSTIPISRP